MTDPVDDLATAVWKLVEQNQELGQKVIALSSLAAILLREVCLLKPDAKEHLAQLEAQIGGFSEAIARQVTPIDDVSVNSVTITSTLEQALHQARELLDRSLS